MTVDRDAPDIQQFLGATAPAPTQSGRPGALPIGLPMPRDRSTLFDPARAGARRASRRAAGSPSRSPTAGSSWPRRRACSPATCGPLHYFGRDLVLFRTERASPAVLDAHCPHLGAHLAVGRPGRGRLPSLPVPRLEVRRRVRPTASRSPTARAPASRPGPRPLVPDHRAQPHDLGLVPRRGRATRSTTCPRSPSSPTPTGSPIVVPRVRHRGLRPRTWPRTTSTSPTSGTCTAPTPSPRTSSSSTAPTSGRSAGRQLRARGLRPRSRRAAGQGLRHLPVVDHPDRRRATCTSAGCSPRPAPTVPTPLEQAADIVLRRGVSQDIPIWENKMYRRPAGDHQDREVILEHRRWSQQFYSNYDGDPATDVEDET